MPPINAVLETALYVDNLDSSQNFYQTIFGFATLLRDERMCALKISDAPLQMLLLFRKGGSTQGAEMPGGFIPPHDGHGDLHLAFSIGESELANWKARLVELDIEIESEVSANGGHSLYFRDRDHHCIELGTPQLWQV